MKRKRDFYYLLKIITVIIVSCLLTYRIGRGTLLGINKFEMKEYASLQKFDIINAKLLNENTIYSITNDSHIILKNVNNYVQNVVVEIDETSQNAFVIQVFYDTGHGYNEKEVSSIWGKVGDNYLPLNCKSKIHSIRIDATNMVGHQLTIGKIIINKQPSPKALSLILIFNVAFLIFITFFYIKHTDKTYKILTFTFYAGVLYIADRFWLINVPPVFNILFFIVLCLMSIVIPLLWKEVKKSGEE